MAVIKTVKVQMDNEQGFFVMNKEDLVQGQKIFVEKAPEPKAQAKTKNRKRKELKDD